MSFLHKFTSGDNTNNELYKAIYSNDLEKVNAIIDDVGLSYSSLWAGGYDLLLNSVECKHIDIAELLVKKGCNVKSTHSGQINVPKSVIHLVVRQGNMKLLTLLLDQDSSLLNEIEEGDSLLHVAIAECHKDIVEILLRRGIDVECRNGSGMTPLHLAALRGQIDLLQHVLAYGAHIESQDNNGKTSLFLAVSSGHDQVVEKLLIHGANCNCKSKNGQTPLLDATNKAYFEIVKYLLDYEADLNDKNSFGQTPLHIACMQKNIQLVSVLLNAGADVNAVDSNGMVPCDAVVKKQSPRGMYFENSPLSYLLGKHLIILKAAGFYLNTKNQMFYNTFYKMYCDEITLGQTMLSAPSDILSSIVKLCEKQISLMKNTSDRGFTVYSVFKKLRDPLSFVSDSEIDFLTKLNCKGKFSMYERLIQKCLKHSKLRNKLLEQGQENLSFIINLSDSELPTLPEEMIRQILYYLSNDYLKHFNGVVEKINK